MSVHQHGPLIESATQISDLAKGELRAWLEPWFEQRGTTIPIGIASGATADRPTSVAVGRSFFDTTLGKPVWWDGAAWRDATGAAV